MLRPDDSPFFDGEHAGSWKFLVLDEAHTYSGASGIEMAMLIRRLKDRVCRNMEGDLQCIGCSATLVSEQEDYGRAAQFAAKLFGEKFEWEPDDSSRQDVIVAQRKTAPGPSRTFSPDPELYPALDDSIHSQDEPPSIERLCGTCVQYGVPPEMVEEARAASTGDAQRFLYHVLSSDSNVLGLRNMLGQGAQETERMPSRDAGQRTRVRSSAPMPDQPR